MKKILLLIIFLISAQANGRSLKVIDLSENQIEQLSKVCKVWGYLKYYHPAITKGKYNWDKELLNRLPSIINSNSALKTNQLLLNWIKSLDKPPKQVEYTNTEKVRLFPPIQWIEDEDWLGTSLSTNLILLKNAKRGKKSHYVKVENELEFLNEQVYPEIDFEKSGLMLLSLFRYWNIIQYYYPYRYLCNDWERTLKKYIPLFYSVNNSLEYKLLIKELASEINDTHAYVIDDELKSFFGARAPAIDVRKIENQFVVYKLLPGFEHENDIKPGDIITAIDNVNINEKISQLTKYIPASNDVVKEFHGVRLALRTNNQSKSIQLKDGRRSELLTFPIEDLNPQWLRKKSNKILKDNIGYLYIGSVQQGSLDSILRKLKTTKGLIIDLRAYPSCDMVYDLFNYISPEVIDFMKATNGSTSQPGLFTFNSMTFKVSGNPAYYKNRIIVLTNELTLSQAESFARAFQVNPEATILGSATAGADGDVVPIILPGNVVTAISSWGAYYPDETETQGIGIIPDIKIRPTIKGLKEGRDELLEFAIGLINQD